MANQQPPKRKLSKENLAFSEFMEEVREATDRELAEEQGDAQAQANLGNMYRVDKGGALDYAEAVKRYRIGAAQDDADAQYNFGVMYQNGFGVAQDHVEAAKWYRKAAERDHDKAQYSLGCMYADGKGVAQNYAEAYFWFNLAARNGDEDYAMARDIVGTELSATALIAAQRRAREWKPRPQNAPVPRED